GQLEPAVARLENVDLERDGAPGELAGEHGLRPAPEPVAVDLLELEPDRRPAARGARVGEHLEDVLGPAHHRRSRLPGRHCYSTTLFGGCPSRGSRPQPPPANVACRRPPR